MFKTFFLFFLMTSFSLFSHQKSPKIAVIGAGLSGLTAAYRLQEKGYEVTVYEARRRVGGRVFSLNVLGHIAELGGQNILDGGKAENMIHLIQELGLETEESTDLLKLHFYQDGKIFDLKKLLEEKKFQPEELYEQLESIKEKAANMQEVLQILFKNDPLLYQISSTILSGYEGGVLDKLSTLYTETLYHFLLGGLSKAHSNETGEGSIENLMIKGGNGLLAEKLSEKLNVHLDHELTEITKDSQSYNLMFKNGKTIKTDLVLLTIPCPIFRNLVISEKVIPKVTQQKIASIEYGVTTKIVVPILPKFASQGSYSNGRLVAFLNRDDSILNLYYIGEYAKFTPDTICETFEKDLPLLEIIYGFTFSASPFFAKDEAFSFYEGPVGHSWPTDPFALGSYSCIGAGQEELFTSTIEIENETVKTLFAPIDNSFFFAGEHTSTFFDVGGTMEAAVESGEKAARLIQKLL